MKRLLCITLLSLTFACNTGKSGGSAGSTGGDGVQDGNDAAGQITAGATGGGNTPSGTSAGTTATGTQAASVGPQKGTTYPSGPSLSPNSDYVHYLGRVEQGARGGIRFSWPGSGVTVRVTNATYITATIRPNSYVENNVLGVLIDGKATSILTPSDTSKNLTIQVPTGDHLVSIVKRTEAGNGAVLLSALLTDGQFETMAASSGRLIEVLGENATTGYSAAGAAGDLNCNQPVNSVANPNAQDATATYGVLAAQAFGADWSILAYSGRGLMQNYDGSTGNNMAVLYPRLNPIDVTTAVTNTTGASVVVINLGTNDINFWLQNNNNIQPDMTGFQANYLTLLQQIRTLNPDAYIIATNGPTLSNYQCFGATKASGYACSTGGGGTPVLTAWQSAISGAVTQFADKKTSTLTFPANTTDVSQCYMPDAAGHKTMATALTQAIASATGWTTAAAAVSQPAAAKAGTGPKTLTGTFAAVQDPITDPNAGLMKITVDEFPQCHYCSPTAYNPNYVGTTACPNLVGTNEPCQGYCHVEDGFELAFSTMPSTSGNHYSDPKPQGFYTTAIPRGRLTHSMEHGAIIVAYNCPSGCDAEVAYLQTVYNKYPGTNTTAWMVVTPDPTLTGPKFAATSWSWHYTFDTLDDAAKSQLDCFILQHAFYGRECHGDLPTTDPDYSGLPRNCPALLDQYMSTTGG